NTIGLKPSQKAEFLTSVKQAAFRFIGRKGLKNLRERFKVALDISRAFADHSAGESMNFEHLVMGRRLLGMDRDLLGSSIFLSGGSNELFDQLKPKAVKLAESISEADFVVNIA